MNPRLLLVEDDPISLAFLRAVLEAMPATVDIATSAAAALSYPALHDLWLIDVNLPDGGGVALLNKLRLRSARTPALAHTADNRPELHTELQAAGFAGVVLKPISARELQAQVRRVLAASPHPVSSPLTADPATTLWDDAQALAALNGNAEHVQQLRDLFRQELADQRERIVTALAARNYEAARGELHRLRASAGFVGALRVHTAATALSQHPENPDLLHELVNACALSLS